MTNDNDAPEKGGDMKETPVRIEVEQAGKEEDLVSPAPGDEPVVEPSELETLQELLAAREAEVADLRSQMLYQHAEIENFKKRTKKRHWDELEFANEPLLKDLLAVLDNLERAAEHGRETGAEGFAALLEGVGHVLQQFTDVLGAHGVAPVQADGEKFDPGLHEAMLQMPGAEDGKVGGVLQKGYTLKGRLLRPAKVAVTKVAAREGDG